jgi:alpha-tubulin suppressor-like RCC1 family protein
MRAVINLSPAPALTWSVEPQNLATVSADGKITGLAPGTTTVRVTGGGATATATVEVLPPFIDLMVDIFHACARSQARVLYCWGEGVGSQLGRISGSEICFPQVNPNPCSATPRINQAALPFKQISSTCGLTDGGEAYCWGNNGGGLLGPPGQSCDALACVNPTKVRGNIQFSELAVSWGGANYCGLDLQGVAYCWGINSAGNLGGAAPDRCNGDPCSFAPSPVSGGHRFTTLSAGNTHNCALTSAGAAYCWGWNESGQLGNGAFTPPSGTTQQTGEPAPVEVGGGLTFKALSAGYYHTCALTGEGFAYCWGNNVYGKLGIGTSIAILAAKTPMAVVGGLRFMSITTGDDHTCALTAGGEAYCWGRNTRGQLGDATYLERHSPTKVTRTELVFVELRARRNLTCGRVAAGYLYCWGWNAHGGLGAGDVEPLDSNVPVGVGGAR